MRRLLSVSALTLLVVSGCLVAIEDVADPADSGAGGSAGSDASAGGGSAGISGTGADAGAGGQSGSSGGGSAGASGGSGGTGGNAGSGGTGGSAGTGGTTATCVLPFKDDFEDGTPATFWKMVSLGGATASETGGKLQVLFPKTISNFTMAGYLLDQPLDLTSCSVLVRVDETPPSTTNAAASFVLFYGQDGNVEMTKAASTLHFQYFLGPKQFYLGGQSYSPQEHLWWRFRHDAGVLNWETSPDGKQWKTQAVAVLPAQFSALRIGGTAYLQENNVTGSAKFDDFGMPP